ncbi:MAG: 23S rRNA (pseudouridine(1915)-N(3))-methyltransferase RlmH [Oscillospiraceae bacterium]
MIKVTLICVGKLKERYLADACAEYLKRLGAFCRPEVVQVEEERSPDRPSPAQIQAVMQAEGRRILAKIPPSAYLISLCIEGKRMDSEGLSRHIQEAAVSGKSCICLAIGGSFGLSDEVKQASALRLSMSPMTFPHQLARVMLLEQLYRSFQIQSGGKYHK